MWSSLKLINLYLILLILLFRNIISNTPLTKVFALSSAKLPALHSLDLLLLGASTKDTPSLNFITYAYLSTRLLLVLDHFTFAYFHYVTSTSSCQVTMSKQLMFHL